MLDHELELRFCRARRAAIAREFARLNTEQQQAVLTTEGPLLLLAGAGSGKTTVLINRIANLMKYGRGSDSVEVPEWVTPEDVMFLEGYAAAPRPEDKERMERLCRVDPAAPWTILAITFTNKAAGELKDRLERMLGPEANDIWASTFHSACVASCVDVAILVGKKHTAPIAEGLTAAGFYPENLHVTASLAEAAEMLRRIGRSGDVVLFENDLPDNYSEQ